MRTVVAFIVAPLFSSLVAAGLSNMPVHPLALGLFGVLGAVAGCVFWLIARPDKVATRV